MLDLPTTRAEFPEKLRLLFAPSRYKVMHGGRGGGKSWGVARALLVLGMRFKLRILCARELQLSIKDSVHRLLCDQIEELGYGDYADTTNNAIKLSTGTEFLFSGISRNIKKIKSMEAIDLVWVEEAESVSEDSWSVLIPTIRKEGSEIWITFNPDQDTDPTYKRFVKDPPPDTTVIDIGWEDNPWIPSVLVKEKDYLYRVDPDAAAHVWGGKTRKHTKAQILFGKWSVETFTVLAHWHGPYQGADWGYSVDPTTLVRCWIEEIPTPGEEPNIQNLYIEREKYQVGVEVVDTPAMFDNLDMDNRKDARRFVTRADNARPETISHMRNNKYGKLVAAEKGPGSVEDGIMHLRSFHKIVIHQRCTYAAQEARLWSWKVDPKTKDILPEPVDKHNHIFDAVRYAVEPIMKRKKVAYDEYKSGAKRGAPVSGSRGVVAKRGIWKNKKGGML